MEARLTVDNLMAFHTPRGVIPLAQIDCTLMSGTKSVTLSALAADPDVSGYKKTKIFGKQGAYVALSAVFFDGVSYIFAPPFFVPSCRLQWSIRDRDKNLDFGALDLMTGTFSCGADAATALGLDAIQSGLLNDTFGSKPKCTVTGMPFPGGCFRGDTLVHSEHGVRPIRDIRVGERVWSWNEKNGNHELAPVLQSIVRPAADLPTLDTGAEVFQGTGGHPFWVDGKGWVKAADLSSGDDVRTATGQSQAVTSNRSAEETDFYAGYDLESDHMAAWKHPLLQLRPASYGPGPSLGGVVCNLELGGNHTFYVGTSATLVHNK